MKNTMELAIVKGQIATRNFLTRKRAGLDGILVTVGLCIVALLLCVVMKNSLTTFIETIVKALTTKATSILAS